MAPVVTVGSAETTSAPAVDPAGVLAVGEGLESARRSVIVAWDRSDASAAVA
jgi:hypothetical protein